MDKFEHWFNEFETLVINLQMPEYTLADLQPDDFRGFYESGLTPYETLQIEFPDDYE